MAQYFTYLPLMVGIDVRLMVHGHKVTAHLLHVVDTTVGQLQQQLVGSHARHAVRAPATHITTSQRDVTIL